jgi:hypothetical protein
MNRVRLARRSRNIDAASHFREGDREPHETFLFSLQKPARHSVIIDTTTPLVAYRFATSEDLMALFQAQLDRFPRMQTNHGPKRMFSEFGGFMIRPRGESRNRLTSIVFPETVLAIPGAGRSLRTHTDRTFPQARLMAAVGTNSLLCQVMADRLTDDNLNERVCLVLSMGDVFFNSDIWDFFAIADQQALRPYGFGADMTSEQWAKAISTYPNSVMDQYELDGQVVDVKGLPYRINQRGMVGTIDSFHQMPGYLLDAILENSFSENGAVYEIGSAHIHPKKELSRFWADVAKKVGERAVQMTVSPNDVRDARGSQASHNEILRKHKGVTKSTGITFTTIVGVGSSGEVVDIQHVDFGLIRDMGAMRQLNDRTLETLQSGHPDIGLVAAHYQFFSDPTISAKELGGDVGQHVGDPNYRMGEDEPPPSGPGQ